MSITPSSIKISGGVPTLYIDNAPVTPTAYITYLTENNCYADFAKAGIKLFSLPVFFCSHTFSEVSQLQSFSPGIFDTDPPDFSLFDRQIEEILEACPDAYIFPRVNVNLSPAWEEAHPDELNDTPCDKHPLSKRRVCFSSDLWAEEICRLITLYVRHVQSAPYVRHILGYQIAGGNTDEWYSFDQKGSIGKRSREKYSQYLAQYGLEDTEAEYYTFLSYMIAERIRLFASHIKALTENKQVVGTFYGYSLITNRQWLQHALYRLLDGSEIDFICNPPNYAETRKPGRDHFAYVPVDSLKLHGKLLFAENDVRTHLSRPVNDTAHYNTPIWFGPDPETTKEVMLLHFARVITHGHASWWFDMWGGWYKDDRYMSLIASLRNVAERALSMPRKSAAEVAIFLDEHAYAYLPDGTGVNYMVDLLANSGIPYDLYLTHDFEKAFSGYKAVCLLSAYPTKELRKAEKLLSESKIPHIIVKPDSALETSASVRAFAKDAGIHLYTDKPAVVHASQSHLFVHTVNDEPLKLCLPEGVKAENALTGEAVGSEIRLPAAHGILMELKREN